MTYLNTPLPLTFVIVIVACGLLGVAIERIGLRPLAGSARIAPLLAEIARAAWDWAVGERMKAEG